MAALKPHIVLLILLVAGCASVDKFTKMDKFEQTADAYENSVRWSDWDMAASFIKDKMDPKIGPQLQNLKQYNVTAYTVKTFVPSDDQSKVLIVANVQYFKKNGLLLKNYSHRQIWEYDEKKEAWYLTSGLPELE